VTIRLTIDRVVVDEGSLGAVGRARLAANLRDSLRSALLQRIAASAPLPLARQSRLESTALPSLNRTAGSSLANAVGKAVVSSVWSRSGTATGARR